MKSIVKCDWCGKKFEREKSQQKGKKHQFCSRSCLAAFSSKTKNPNSYRSLKSYTNISKSMTELNRKMNPYRMTLPMRQKIRESKLNSGKGITYKKYYGRHEHRVVAEKILGRQLLPGEVVHHRDGNKRNNICENIIVFKNQSEHAKHHAELKWFICEIEEMNGGDAI